VILFGIRGSASIINPILLAAVITITVLPVPSRLSKRGVPGWLALVLSILMVVLILGLVIATVFFSITKLTTELPTYMASASQQASGAFTVLLVGFYWRRLLTCCAMLVATMPVYYWPCWMLLTTLASR
jgi:predicted PurR-regulated permease PerM